MARLAVFVNQSKTNWQLSTDNCPLTTVHWQLSTDNCQLSTDNCQLTTVNWQLSTDNCQLTTVNWLLTTDNWLQTTGNCQITTDVWQFKCQLLNNGNSKLRIPFSVSRQTIWQRVWSKWQKTQSRSKADRELSKKWKSWSAQKNLRDPFRKSKSERTVKFFASKWFSTLITKLLVTITHPKNLIKIIESQIRSKSNGMHHPLELSNVNNTGLELVLLPAYKH